MPEKSRILVADDEPKILMFIRANLAGRGYEVHVAQDGLEAVDVAARVIPDVIVLDVNMPRMDGIEVCHRIREWSNVPIIMLSVRGDEVDKVRALDEGADDYITKPLWRGGATGPDQGSAAACKEYYFHMPHSQSRRLGGGLLKSRGQAPGEGSQTDADGV